MQLRRKLAIASLVAVPVLGVGGTVWVSSASGAGATTVAPAGQPGSNLPAQSVDPAETADIPEQAGPEGAAASEPDGPGGHADPGGTNVDNQFQGQE